MTLRAVQALMSRCGHVQSAGSTGFATPLSNPRASLSASRASSLVSSAGQAGRKRVVILGSSPSGSGNLCVSRLVSAFKEYGFEVVPWEEYLGHTCTSTKRSRHISVGPRTATLCTGSPEANLLLHAPSVKRSLASSQACVWADLSFATHGVTSLLPRSPVKVQGTRSFCSVPSFPIEVLAHEHLGHVSHGHTVAEVCEQVEAVRVVPSYLTPSTDELIAAAMAPMVQRLDIVESNAAAAAVAAAAEAAKMIVLQVALVRHTLDNLSLLARRRIFDDIRKHIDRMCGLTFKPIEPMKQVPKEVLALCAKGAFGNVTDDDLKLVYISTSTVLRGQGNVSAHEQSDAEKVEALAELQGMGEHASMVRLMLWLHAEDARQTAAAAAAEAATSGSPP